jgi:hypothetical protein
MSVLSVLLNTEKVIVIFVSLSYDRMSSETQEAINGHCARDNRVAGSWGYGGHNPIKPFFTPLKIGFTGLRPP